VSSIASETKEKDLIKNLLIYLLYLGYERIVFFLGGGS